MQNTKIEYSIGNTFSLQIFPPDDNEFTPGMQLQFIVAVSEQTDPIIDKRLNLNSNSIFDVTLDESDKSKLPQGEYIYKMITYENNKIITEVSGFFDVIWGASSNKKKNFIMGTGAGLNPQQKKDLEDNTAARHIHLNSDALNKVTSEKIENWDNFEVKLKYYGRTDIEITPAYKLGEIIPEEVEMCLIYEVDEETQTASITGYHAPYFDWETESPSSDEYIYYDVVIPYEVEGYPVTKIGDFAFEDWRRDGHAPIEEYVFNKSGLLNIVLPTTIEHLGDYALASTDLRTFKMPPTIKSIGDGVFNYCTNLEELDFGDEISDIPGYTCNECYGLHRIKLPRNLLRIGDYAFYDCELNEVEIPESVTEIGKEAFSCYLDDLDDVFWNVSIRPQIIFLDKCKDDKVLNYNQTAFKYCEGIFVCHNSIAEKWCKENGYAYKYTDVDPENLSVNSAKFDSAGNNIENTFKDMQKLIAKMIKPEYITNASYMFADGANQDLQRFLNTEHITIANNTYKKNPTENISFDAVNCESMQHCFESSSAITVIFPNGTPKLTLANNIFSKCAGLTSITGLDCTNVTTLKYAFDRCSSLETVDLVSTANVKDFSYAFYNSGLKTITGLDTSSAEHLDGAFSKSAIESITIDCANVVSATGVFTDCLSLLALTLKNLNDSGVALEIFNSLPTTEAGTITLENSEISEEVKTIASEKGWIFNE